MDIVYTVVYHPLVVAEDIPALNGAWKKKVKIAIEQRLTTEPTLYGKPLRRDLHGCYKLRVGDYRVIYTITKQVVSVIVIQHRKKVYESDINKRT